MHVARFLQDFPNVLLKEREQPSDVLPSEAHQEGQIGADHQRQHYLEAPRGHAHVEMETLHTPAEDQMPDPFTFFHSTLFSYESFDRLWESVLTEQTLWFPQAAVQDSLRLHLCHVGRDEGAPVPSLHIELREPQTLHQLQENPGNGQAVQPCRGERLCP